MRNNTRALSNAARKYDTEEYKKETGKAKRADFIRPIDKLSTIKDTSRFRKILSKQQHLNGNLQNEEGGWIKTAGNTIELLLEKRFPWMWIARRIDKK